MDNNSEKECQAERTAGGNHEQLPVFLQVEVFQAHLADGKGTQNSKAVRGPGRKETQSFI